MVFRVNRLLPPGEKFPHSIAVGQQESLRTLYKGFYPRSSLYELTLVSAGSVLAFAAIFVLIKFLDM
jgi:hypothetical protein